MAFSAKFALALVVLCFSQVAMSAHVRRSAEESSSPMQELEVATDQLNTITQELNKLISSFNIEEMMSSLDAMVKELEESAKNMTEELKRQYEMHGVQLPEYASATFTNETHHLNATLENMRASVSTAMEEATASEQ